MARGPKGPSESHRTSYSPKGMNVVGFEPTIEMVAFYEKRTRDHIARVAHCLSVMSGVTEYGDELEVRAKWHDASKFGEKERVAYIWITEYHRRRRNGESFSYPDGVEGLVKKAIDHHLRTNRHHPEFHANPNDMSDVDLIEMVCDWTAVSQEFGQDNGSAMGWADKTIGRRLFLNRERAGFIYHAIGLLDTGLAKLDGPKRVR